MSHVINRDPTFVIQRRSRTRLVPHCLFAPAHVQKYSGLPSQWISDIHPPLYSPTAAVSPIVATARDAATSSRVHARYDARVYDRRPPDFMFTGAYTGTRPLALRQDDLCCIDWLFMPLFRMRAGRDRRFRPVCEISRRPVLQLASKSRFAQRFAVPKLSRRDRGGVCHELQCSV